MKRHLAATRWFAFVLLLAAVANGLPEKYACPKNCSCSPEGLDEYELSCPLVGDRQIAVQLKPRDKAIFQCQVHTSPDDFKLLKDVYIEAGSRLDFRLCPLPEVPFTDLLQLRNATSILSFTFASYRKFNGTIERGLFRGLTGINLLSLENNGLTALPSDLFMDMPHLQRLYLQNNLVQLPADLFQPVLSLEIIELGKNELTTLPVDLFRNLKKLNVLNLWKNKLSNLSPEMFQDLTSLVSLDIRHNGLSSLPTDIFKYLTSLNHIRLDGNEFQTLPAGLFNSNKRLITINISDSRKPNLKLPNGIFADLPNLTTVNLNNVGLREIPEDSFRGSTRLTNISLQNNQLKELPPLVFSNASDLEKLNLGLNHINSLPDQIFQQCKKLKILDLSFNKIINLTKNSLESLEALYMQNNILQYIDSNTFPKNSNLKVINLSNNKLSFNSCSPSLTYEFDFQNNSPLSNCLKLQELYLTNNSISHICSDWRLVLTDLKVLRLSHNALQVIDYSSDFFISNPEIDVRHNNISIVNLESAEEMEKAQAQTTKKNNDKRQKWLLDGNPLSCDCSSYDFLRYIEGSIAPEVINRVEYVLGNLACASPEKWVNEPVTKVRSKAVTCPWHTLPGEKSFCPYPCSCEFRIADFALIIDCINKSLTEAPAELPTNSTKSNHTELYLTGNKLQSLPDFNQPGYQRVSKLALGYNKISSLKNATMVPQIMQVIELHHNNLTMIELDTMKMFNNLTSITLHHNPWKCECQLQPVVSFVQVNHRKILSLDETKCTNGQKLLEQTVTGLCSQTTSIVWVSFLIALLLGGLIGGAFAVYYKFTHEIKAWLFAHNLCLWLVTEEELDSDKIYDAFVSFSQKDEAFIVNELVPHLEGGTIPLKLCLHYRDWVAGEYIPNQITRSVEDSRRTLVVLSPNFVESVWGRMEFRAAHCQALSEGRARVIVVLLGDIGPTENLDPELRAYLNMNTYVKWGDPWFWEKLRYALPHPPKAMKGSIGLVNRNGKHINGITNEDKIELICDPNALPPVTTPPAETNVTDPLSIKNALNGKHSSPRKVSIPSHETNGTAAAVG